MLLNKETKPNNNNLLIGIMNNHKIRKVTIPDTIWHRQENIADTFMKHPDKKQIHCINHEGHCTKQ